MENDTRSKSVALPGNLAPGLLDLRVESTRLYKQINIVESLHFPQIFERVETIKDAYSKTFEWLFEETENCAAAPGKYSCLLDWLRMGSGTFFISGKAGSGKSTLMKFLHQHKKTTTVLKQWAGGKALLVASFFFWNAGTSMQKSRQGLLRTLLSNILTQAPELIAVVCPERWQSSSATESPWTQMT